MQQAPLCLGSRNGRMYVGIAQLAGLFYATGTFWLDFYDGRFWARERARALCVEKFNGRLFICKMARTPFLVKVMQHALVCLTRSDLGLHGIEPGIILP